MSYLENNHLLLTTQSGFRRGHSTETATIRVLSDLDAADRACPTRPHGAFDTVDHEVLLEGLRVTFGVQSSAIAWISVLPG